MFGRLTTIGTLSLVVALTGHFSQAETGTKKSSKFIAIGTAGTKGVYHPLGTAIASILNRDQAKLGIKATVETTAGSVYNANSLASGDIDLGLVQADLQYNAVSGRENWAAMGKQTKLRALFSLYPELITIVAAKDAGIQSVADLKGKRINVGNLGSGTRSNALDVLKAVGMSLEDVQAEAFSADVAPRKLQDGLIDAYFFTVGDPQGHLAESANGERDVRIISISGLTSLLNSNPYYVASAVSHDVQSVGTAATLMTTSRMSDEMAYEITKRVFENLNEIRSISPALANLDERSMLTSLSAPIHKGALKYYREAGLIGSLEGAEVSKVEVP